MMSAAFRQVQLDFPCSISSVATGLIKLNMPLRVGLAEMKRCKPSVV